MNHEIAQAIRELVVKYGAGWSSYRIGPVTEQHDLIGGAISEFWMTALVNGQEFKVEISTERLGGT